MFKCDKVRLVEFLATNLMKNTKVSKIMLSTLVTGGVVFGSLVASATNNEVEAPNTAKGETQIELPSSALVSIVENNTKRMEEIKAEGERLQYEREQERLRIEREKARKAEEARLAHIEAERKAKEEAERKAREEAERQRQAEIARQKAIEEEQRKKAQQAQEQQKQGTAFNGSYYTPSCTGCSGVTATGYDVRGSIYVDGMRVIAVDPNVIPLYSIVQVSTPYETFQAIALDTGGAIKGHKVDILVADKTTARNLGRHTVYIKVIRSGK